MRRPTHRRDFLKQATAAGFGFWAAGGLALRESRAANEKVNIAIIGAGGQGGSNLGSLANLGNIVALCDVDEGRAASGFKRFPEAKKYHDFRKMLDEMQKSIDAVVVSTPDHCHAPASVMAMKLGKHVYCEKPLTWCVHEARVMRETAAKMKVATQMGNHGTASSGLRRGVELIQNGVIGPVKEVHLWTNRPIWPQGMARPAEAQEVPATLKWDLWLGPAAERPYNKAYLPFNWRGWLDFGTGALGDMGCHTANLAFMALKLGAPKTVQAESSPINGASFPTWARVVHEFPGRGDLVPVTLTWYEGRKDGKLLQPPEELLSRYKAPQKGYRVWFEDSKDGRRVFRGDPDLKGAKKGGPQAAASGCFMVGETGILFSPDDYGGESYIIRDGRVERTTGAPEKLPQSPGHHKEWIEACKGGKPAMSNFDYAGPLTEFILLGNVAMRAGKKLEWDAAALKATNAPEADQFIRREYRKGWTL
jgi:predicted dehydrogenase